MRVLGLDIGDRRIGLALSDPGAFLASSLGAIERRGAEKDIMALLALVNQHEVERVIVGLPRRLDGSLGEQALKVQSFAENLKELCPVPMEYWDERFSTFNAQERLREAGAKRPKKGRVDSAAAAFILQGYLDRLQGERASGL